MIDWLLAFVATCTIEVAVVWLLGPRGRRAHQRWLPVTIVAQAATHPLVWIAMATLPGSQLVRLACVEVGAVIVEAALYRRGLRMPAREAFALSAVANAASLLIVAAFALIV
jgi:hypothetical protein